MKGIRGGRQNGSYRGSHEVSNIRDQYFLEGLKDGNTLNEFIRNNLNNPVFKEFGRSKETNQNDIKVMWFDRSIQEQKGTLHETSIEEAAETIRQNISDNVLTGWFRDANSDYKPSLITQMARNAGTYNAALNVAYYNYVQDNQVTGKTSLPFDTWLRTPMTLYRGDRGQTKVGNDIFNSYSTDRKIAEKFGSNITEIKIRPIDTWGSYQTTGEYEYLVPVQKWKDRNRIIGK